MVQNLKVLLLYNVKKIGVNWFVIGAVNAVCKKFGVQVINSLPYKPNVQGKVSYFLKLNK